MLNAETLPWSGTLWKFLVECNRIHKEKCWPKRQDVRVYLFTVSTALILKPAFSSQVDVFLPSLHISFYSLFVLGGHISHWFVIMCYRSNSTIRLEVFRVDSCWLFFKLSASNTVIHCSYLMFIYWINNWLKIFLRPETRILSCWIFPVGCSIVTLNIIYSK